MNFTDEQIHFFKDLLIKTYLNKQVHVIIDDPYHPIDACGVVDSVDDALQLFGTWGGLAAIPGIDTIILLED